MADAEGKRPDSVHIRITQANLALDPILQSFVSYYESTYSSGLEGDRIPKDKRVPEVRRAHSTADSCTGALVRLLADKLEQQHAIVDAQTGALTEALTHYRTEMDITDVYKGRIVDLQKVINGTKLPHELTALIGRQDVVVPMGADSTDHQLQREAVHGVSRLAAKVKDGNERLRAQNAMLSSQVAGLLAENTLLMDRITLLEEQVSALGTSASVTMRALNKARSGGGPQTHTNTGSRSASGSSQRPLRANETAIAGITMDKETAAWLKEVYSQLSAGKEVEEAIRAVAGRTLDGSASQRPAHGTTSTTRGVGASVVSGFANYVAASRTSTPLDPRAEL